MQIQDDVSLLILKDEGGNRYNIHLPFWWSWLEGWDILWDKGENRIGDMDFK